MAITMPIISTFNEAGVQKAIKQFESLTTTTDKAGFIMGKAFLPAVAALGAITAATGFAVKAAVEDEAAQVSLANTLRNTTQATDEQISATETMIAKLQMATGVADEELRPAYAALTRGTKDIATANKALALTLDIAAGANVSVQQTADALAMAYGGNMRALAQLSPELKVMIKDGASLDQVMATLSRTFAGSASTAANSAQGQFKRLNVALDEAKESIGKALLPAILAVLPYLVNFGNWAQNNTPIIVGLAVAIAGIATAVIAVNTALALYKVAAAIATVVNFALATSFTAANVAATMGVAAVTIAAGLVAAAIALNKFKAAAGATVPVTTAAASSVYNMSEKTRELTNQTTAENRSRIASNDWLDKWNTTAAKTTAGTASLDTATKKLKDTTNEQKQAVTDLANALKREMNTALDDAGAKLVEAQARFDDFASTVSTAITQGIDFKAAYEMGNTSGEFTFGTALEEQAQKAKDFADTVKKLIAAGLSEPALQQVLKAGVDAGTLIGKELLSSTDKILKANEIVNTLNEIAALVGTSAAAAFYQAGVTDAKAYLQGVADAMQGATNALGGASTIADVKGIGATFADVVSNIGAVPMSITNPISVPADIRGGTNNGGNTNIITINTVTAPATLGQTIVDALTDYQQFNGVLDLNIRGPY